jgi:hypothetical protein
MSFYTTQLHPPPPPPPPLKSYTRGVFNVTLLHFIVSRKAPVTPRKFCIALLEVCSAPTAWKTAYERTLGPPHEGGRQEGDPALCDQYRRFPARTGSPRTPAASGSGKAAGGLLRPAMGDPQRGRGKPPERNCPLTRQPYRIKEWQNAG